MSMMTLKAKSIATNGVVSKQRNNFPMGPLPEKPPENCAPSFLIFVSPLIFWAALFLVLAISQKFPLNHTKMNEYIVKNITIQVLHNLKYR